MSKWKAGTITSVIALLIALAAGLLVGTSDGAPAAQVLPKIPEAPSASIDTQALAQCRVDAVIEYMTLVGFEDGDYVIGEERLDKSLPEFSEAGSLAFGLNGQVVDSKEALQGVFESKNPELVAVTNTQVKKFEGQFTREEVLNISSWEVVQMLVPVRVAGNTGFNDGKVVSSGVRKSAAGDAFWLFIDPSTCTVPTAQFDSTGNAVDPDTEDKDKPVGFIRVGCINPGDRPEPEPKCPWNPTLPPDHPDCLQSKDPSDSTAQNPDVPDWIKDEPSGGNHTVNNNDGATDSRGLQTDPAKDAKAAEDAAKAETEKVTEEHEQAIDDAVENGGGVVDEEQEHTEAPAPPPDW
ncbi:hypothetical protein GW930_02115 [Candidatus Saccharibacteria bacterium]|nr:hypothetical protein [Candidatus Saccharibacteria bacterium]